MIIPPIFAARVVFTHPIYLNWDYGEIWWNKHILFIYYLFYINWSLSGIPAWPANLPQRRPQPPEVGGGYTSDESVGGTREKFPPRRIKHRIAAFQWFCANDEIFYTLATRDSAAAHQTQNCGIPVILRKCWKISYTELRQTLICF